MKHYLLTFVRVSTGSTVTLLVDSYANYWPDGKGKSWELWVCNRITEPKLQAMQDMINSIGEL